MEPQRALDRGDRRGFDGGEVIPQSYDGSRASLDELRSNILKSGQVGRLVANDFRSSIVDVPLLEVFADPEDQSRLLNLDYREFSHALEEKIRDKYQAQDPNVEIHIVGFAKKVGDLIDGLVAVVMFFGVAFLITMVLLYLFTHCSRSTAAVLITTLIAVIWQLGLMNLAGFGIDPYSMLVPFLIFAIGISHGVQKINGIAQQSSGTDSPLTAARLTFRQLFLPGMIAILADAVGFITLLIIDIGVIHELAIGASIGVAVIVFTNLILLPVAISYLGISKRAVQLSKQYAASNHPFWRLLSNFANPVVAPISVVLALVVAIGASGTRRKTCRSATWTRARRNCVRTRATTRITTTSSATTRPVPTCWWSWSRPVRRAARPTRPCRPSTS